MLAKWSLHLCFFFSLFANFFAFGDNYPKNNSIDILHYKFELTLSDDTDEIVGKTTIQILFKKEGVTGLRLDLTHLSDSLKGKGMTVESVYQGTTALNFTHKGNVLWIPFTSLANAATQTSLIINYHGVPADGLRIGPTMHGDRSFFNENWPNRARHWLPVIDHPYEKATSEFLVIAPAHYQVVSNGLLQEETNLDGKTKLTHWKQLVPVSSWLYVLGVAEFAVQYLDTFEGKSIQTWVYPRNREAGFYDFAEPTKQVLGFFTDYVGPYVYEKLANIQTPSVHGGMETSSAIFYGEDLIDGKRSKRLRNIVIHEIAHQWFGNAVTESTWDDAWLSEGFATYFTMLFIEHAYGRAELLEQLNTAKQKVYEYAEKDPTYKIIDNRSPENIPVTNALTYQKGAWILHMLRNQIGDLAFKQGIREYYRNFMNSNATTTDFRLAMERVSGKDLKIFFNQWLYQGGNLTVNGYWHFNNEKKQLEITLEQTQAKEFVFDVDVEVAIYYAEKPLGEMVGHKLDSRKLTFTIPCKAKPNKVELDPNSILLAKVDFAEKK